MCCQPLSSPLSDGITSIARGLYLPLALLIHQLLIRAVGLQPSIVAVYSGLLGNYPNLGHKVETLRLVLRPYHSCFRLDVFEEQKSLILLPLNEVYVLAVAGLS